MTSKPYRIEWRPMARDDLRAIVRYIGKESPVRAKSFGQELRDKTKPLAHHPEFGRKGRLGLPIWIRELVVHPNYMVFYRVWNETRTVEILRIQHVAQHPATLGR
ncbi:MAG: type II toxin-antitoxin system RelE/ParE family toxin [Rectinemataceae bacterium]|nr:type II toxin-antitoxin system RelE/ParE family toxin [Rectinemataceae bacterium]